MVVKNLMQGWTWQFMPIIPATQETEVERSWFKASLGVGLRPYLKNKLKVKRPGNMAQVVEQLSWASQ
jgi:hypothetical protein